MPDAEGDAAIAAEAAAAATSMRRNSRTSMAVVRPLALARLEPWRAPLTALAAKQVGYPEHGRIEWARGAAREVIVDGESIFVAPLRVVFSEWANSYCRLSVIRPMTSNAVLVPQLDDFDNCKGIELAVVVDLNGDDMPDFVFAVRIPSNRYAAIVRESEAFLSTPDGTYCYSPGVANAILPSIGTPEAARSAVERSISRLGPTVLDCFTAR